MAYIPWNHGTTPNWSWVYDTTQDCWYQVWDSSAGQSWPDRIADHDDSSDPKITLWTGSSSGERAILTPNLVSGPSSAAGVQVVLDYVPRGYVSGEGPQGYFASHVGSLQLHRWGTVLTDAAQQNGLTKVMTVQRKTSGGGYALVVNGYATGIYNPSSSDIDRIWVHAV